jgi:cytoskeletal protein CcmA (bactofilin family)
MFGKKSTSSAEPTVIGRGAIVEGTIRLSGHIQIDGHIEGKLEVDGQVSVGPNGSINGEVSADELIIGGKVEGKATARAHLHVASGGAVRGEVRYGSLQIDRGGLIDGRTGHGQTAEGGSAARDSEPEERHAPPALPGARAGAAVS